ncbi:MAG: tetratricopeptide repeat protein [Myxococcota bacterium]
MATLVAGWLAQMLASTDPDIDAGVTAYEAEDYEEALARFDAAKEQLGERPEVAFDRGLALLRLDKLDEARGAFERASEADDDPLRASAFYELGNLEFDAESYDVAIERYIEALKANPLHENAKWNLELALLKKKEQEEEQEEQEEQENEDEQDEGEESEDEQDEGEESEDEQQQDEGEESEDEQQQDEGEESEDEQQQDEGEESEDEQQQDEGEASEDEQQQDEGEASEDEQPQPEEGEESEDEQPQPAEPKPVDRMDMERALQKLDEQDPFTLDKPGGGYVQPEKDW